jgi:hypothetical protein
MDGLIRISLTPLIALENLEDLVCSRKEDFGRVELLALRHDALRRQRISAGRDEEVSRPPVPDLVVQSELLVRQETIKVIEPELRLGHLLRRVSSEHLAVSSEADRDLTAPLS